MPEEKTAAEIQAEEEAAARARGDFIDENNPPGDLKGDAEEEELNEEEPEEEEPEEEEPEEEEPEEEEPEEEEEEEEPILAAEEEEEPRIPKSRFDAAQRAARMRQEELEKKIQAYEKKAQQETTTTDFSKLSDTIEELSTQYEDLLLEGELEKARKVRVDRDKKQNELFEMRLTQQSQVTGMAAVEQMRFDAQLAQLEAKYSVINPDSDAFDQNVTDEVNTLLNAFRADGFTHTAALNKAVHYVLRDDAPVSGEDPDLVRSKRAQRARKRVAKVAKKSPPDIKKTGRDSDKQGTDDGLPDINKLSVEQFDNLSEEQLQKLRQDSILSDEEVA